MTSKISNKERFRTCLICRQHFPKEELFRIVRTKDGKIIFDDSYKINGRGAYIMKNGDCKNHPKLRLKLQVALKAKISDEEYELILERLIKGE